ncbi:hypothetical protein PHYBLDRAFT_174168 [Phycomyces blakesleeanus NRRL 1555(-)]|uniref:Uncharacterized protein n=1 Tax=Phycomyces blakesleeanus (strain ATCC 8743b / DSM 1359 / FGSC 10004 / NBRC 33097 / NRRL 1555) TaxID=763407 RepID=A0A162ZKS3_PHYB8|nr:hypothetical protein PHYBLDRAFT_174168 [Phycomyces blakesleeanus NRRL 1555(-)]OAD67471.1 hypothetical protein PHYBLDRAFT_174168 [Phycomyces blakesleeanus NRRL 1555(-)]|eukprot:XP_018285511.1 hypothetical protein PHYBLDRAFT_174168 [Phycomyces blakesleeanus NRRL 1555(-)]
MSFQKKLLECCSYNVKTRLMIDQDEVTTRAFFYFSYDRSDASISQIDVTMLRVWSNEQHIRNWQRLCTIWAIFQREKNAADINSLNDGTLAFQVIRPPGIILSG